jgi:hypothetical protein
MINTKTLTCTHCGGARFTRLGRNDYQCQHCDAVTLVEDDVAQRLEQLLQQLQTPASPVRPFRSPAAVVPVVLAVAAVGVLLWHNVFFNGDLKQDTQGAWLEADRLLPGESAPVLWRLPDDRPFTRFEVQKDGLSAARSFQGRATVTVQKPQLVQQGRKLTFVGALTNADTVQAGRLAVRISLYDADRRLVGFGRAAPRVAVLGPGEKSLFSVDCTRLGTGEVASHDFLVDSERLGLVQQGDGAAVTSTTVREPRLRTFDEGLDLTAEELLDDGFALFDSAHLKLTRPSPAVDSAGHRIFLAELVNESPTRVVLKPRFTVTFFDGHREVARVEQQPVPWLAPGERAPLQFSKGGLDAYTDLRVEWASARGVAPPGPSRPLTVELAPPKARLGNVLVNFTSRRTYKYVRFRGHVKNTGSAAVKSPVLTLSLLDGTGQLTGFATEHLHLSLAPGEQAPFELDVPQGGADFVRYTVLVR